jgi:16S rRNA (adenine1518-N6/adenine1519-N6)-dimethyltransferase
VPIVPLAEFHRLEKFLRLMFSQKRKQLKGILKSNYPVNLIETTFNELNISLDIRAEALSFDQVILLYRKFTK